MSAFFSRQALILVIFLVSCFTLKVQAIGEDVEELGSSPSGPTGPAYQLEVSPMGRFQTEHYTRRLNARLNDLGLAIPPKAEGKLLSENDVGNRVEVIRGKLASDSHSQNLIYLDNTPDGRKVHALLMREVPAGSPNVAILSTPRHWTSLNQMIQLHTFADVDNIARSDLHRRLKDEFNYVGLDALARNALPKTPESSWRSLLSRPLR